MGTWGSGPFENDDAMDWIADLVAGDDFSDLEEALDEVLDDSGEVDVVDANIAVAAVAVLAEFIDPQDSESLPPELVEWIHSVEEEPDPELLEMALEALDAATGEESELTELWEEDEAWHDMIESLRVRVSE
jgi:hypothetical protein